MIQVNSVEEANGQWINEWVQLLTTPRLNADGQWTALANAYGILAIVKLKMTSVSVPPTVDARHE
jgi:hypothetical protein